MQAPTQAKANALADTLAQPEYLTDLAQSLSTPDGSRAVRQVAAADLHLGTNTAVVNVVGGTNYPTPYPTPRSVAELVKELAAAQSAEAALVANVASKLDNLEKTAEESQTATARGLAAVGVMAFVLFALQVLNSWKAIDESAAGFIPGYDWMKSKVTGCITKVGASLKQKLCCKKPPSDEGKMKHATELTPAEYEKVKGHAQEILLLLDPPIDSEDSESWVRCHSKLSASAPKAKPAPAPRRMTTNPAFQRPEPDTSSEQPPAQDRPTAPFKSSV